MATELNKYIESLVAKSCFRDEGCRAGVCMGVSLKSEKERNECVCPWQRIDSSLPAFVHTCCPLSPRCPLICGPWSVCVSVSVTYWLHTLGRVNHPKKNSCVPDPCWKSFMVSRLLLPFPFSSDLFFNTCQHTQTITYTCILELTPSLSSALPLSLLLSFFSSSSVFIFLTHTFSLSSPSPLHILSSTLLSLFPIHDYPHLSPSLHHTPPP